MPAIESSGNMENGTDQDSKVLASQEVIASQRGGRSAPLLVSLHAEFIAGILGRKFCGL